MGDTGTIVAFGASLETTLSIADNGLDRNGYLSRFSCTVYSLLSPMLLPVTWSTAGTGTSRAVSGSFQTKGISSALPVYAILRRSGSSPSQLS